MLNYYEPTSYKFFQFTPYGEDGKKFSTLKVKVVFNKETKEVLDFYWKPFKYRHNTGYTLAKRTKERHDVFFKAMQDQNITL